MKSPLLTVYLLFTTLFLSGCGTHALAWQVVGQPSISPALVSHEPSVTIGPTATSTATPFQPLPPTPTYIPTVTSTLTPTNTPSPTWISHPAGWLEAPILLYHHIGIPKSPSQYYVSPDVFRLQMESLRDWGYTPISITHFVEILLNGGLLPARPVVITFDDGYRDVYENAFPVMQELGFTGVLYLISRYVSGGGFMDASQVREMISAGWEIGNHSATHRDLTLGYSARLVQEEIVQSRLDLEELFGVTVNTFSYPYGSSSIALKQQLKDLGYLAAVGVGMTKRHSAEAVYLLGRSEVRGYFTLADFAALLPWAEQTQGNP